MVVKTTVIITYCLLIIVEVIPLNTEREIESPKRNFLMDLGVEQEIKGAQEAVVVAVVAAAEAVVVAVEHLTDLALINLSLVSDFVDLLLWLLNCVCACVCVL